MKKCLSPIIDYYEMVYKSWKAEVEKARKKRANHTRKSHINHPNVLSNKQLPNNNQTAITTSSISIVPSTIVTPYKKRKGKNGKNKRNKSLSVESN
jgi:hypothetical protein